MIKMWHRLGNAAFWLLEPLIALAMRPTTRTRVLIRSGNEVLVVKGWLGDGRWLLSGGGLHRGENPVNGAAREVREETGIALELSSLRMLADEPYADGRFRYRCVYFEAVVAARPDVRTQRFEIIEAAWLSPSTLAKADVSPDVRRALELASKL